MTVTAVTSQHASETILKPSQTSDFLEELSLEDDDHQQQEEKQQQEDERQSREPDSAGNQPIKCSAVHTLERDMPTFDYSDLVNKLRAKILGHAQANPGLFSERDVNKCRNDDWHLSRFLLRQKLDVDSAFEMLKNAMRYRNESMTNALRAADFPAEFYKIGGLFRFGEDRKGNKMLYMRIEVHRKMPELQTILEAFIFHNILMVDEEANGRGISILLDCTNGGYNNVDMDALMFLITSLTRYFPKGLSYLLVHNIPWILKPIWAIAKRLIPDEYTQIVKFSDSKSIFEYIDSDQLPDYMGGTSKEEYRKVPENCTTLFEAAKLWGLEIRVVRTVLLRFIEHLPAGTLEEFEKLCSESNNCSESSAKTQDAAKPNQESACQA